MNAAAIVALVSGSIAGGVSRFFLGSAIHRLYPTSLPLGTLVVNVAGCVVVGFLSSAGGARFAMTQEARLLLVTGFCGSFTTFSAFILESDALFRGGSPSVAAGYVLLTLAAGFGAFFVGAALGRALPA